MNYHEGLPELFIRMACAAVNWENVESPSNHARQVAKEMRAIFDEHTAPQIDRHLAAATEIITATHENLKIERAEIAAAFEAMDMKDNPGRDGLPEMVKRLYDEWSKANDARIEAQNQVAAEGAYQPRIAKALKRALELSGREDINTAHLLVALCEDNECMAAQTICSALGHGGTLDKLKAEARELTKFRGDDDDQGSNAV